MITEKKIEALQEKAAWVRSEMLKMIAKAGSGHPGGSLSEVEILVGLYYEILKIKPEYPQWPDRDRFVLSKGHCCPPLYAILADKGYFDVGELESLRKYGSILQGHPSIVTPGIDSVSGSLGNGLSVGIGMAMAARKTRKDYRVYVLLGDGELQEGAIWEAAMCATQHRLSNLVAIVDYNGIQINGWVNDIIRLEPLADKWCAFGWNVIEIDGHDLEEVIRAMQHAKKVREPSVIIAHTVKGKGVSFMENNCVWHGASLSNEQLQSAVNEIIGG